MTYNKNDLEKLSENITKIRDFLKTLAPQMGGSFSVKFRCADCNCYIGIYPTMTNPIEGGMGYASHPWETDGTVTITRNTDYFVGIVENWQTIKSEFLQEIERRTTVIEKIHNFQI